MNILVKVYRSQRRAPEFEERVAHLERVRLDNNGRLEQVRTFARLLQPSNHTRLTGPHSASKKVNHRLTSSAPERA